MRSIGTTTKQLCWALAFVLLCMWSGLPEYLAYAGSIQQTNPTKTAETVENLKRLFQALEAAARDIPRETFDTRAVIEQVGRDPTQLFAWVRENTVLVPYRGTLRGPKGVLMDRLGNSLDRALLLAELLRLAGHRVRLARAALSEEQVSAVWQNTRSMPQGGVPAAPSRSQQGPDDLVKKVEQYARQYQLDQAEFRHIIDKLTMEQQRMAEQVAQRVAEQTPVIAAAVGAPAAEDMAAARTAALEALRDHWWVQWPNGSTWVDLDPTFADAEPGRALAEVIETMQPEQLPNRLWHTVEIRLVVEFWEGGRLREVPVLSQDLVPAQLFGDRIAVRHVPVNWPQDLNLVQEKNPIPRLKTTVLAQHEWLPVLDVGSKKHFKRSFTDAGAINENPGANPMGKAVVEGLGWAIKALEDMPTGPLGSAPQRTPERAAQLTAEWIEYEIRTPGQPVRTIRRQIFDLLGPAARATGKPPAPVFTETQRLQRGLALLGESEILLLACQPSPEFVEHSMAKGLLANREVLLDVMQNTASMSPNDLQDKMAKLKPLPSQLYGLGLARQEWSRFRDHVYMDRLNILTYHSGAGFNPEGQLRLSQGVDIVANDVAVRPGSGAIPFLIRLEQGVLDTNAEAFILAHAKISEIQENTAEIFAQSERQGVEWLIIPTLNQSAWQNVELPRDVRVRIKRDLTDGYVVLVPKRAILLEGRPIVGWWWVDPRNGQTLGIGENGWGLATEKQVLLRNMVLTAVYIFPVCLLATAKEGLSDKELLKCTFYSLGYSLAWAWKPAAWFVSVILAGDYFKD